MPVAMKLYTKQGDDGTTGLFGGARVDKHDPRVAAYGEVDETNAALGVVLAAGPPQAITTILNQLQSQLFVLGAELATPSDRVSPHCVTKEHVLQLERWIDEACEGLEPLRNFVMPAGSPASAALHLARTVSRRAERAVIALARQQLVSSLALVYLNRLSDLLFALARRANQSAGVPDVLWNSA